MRRVRLLLTVAALTFVAQAGPVFASDDEVRSEDPKFGQAFRLLDTWLASVVDFERLPGLSLAVVHDQEVLYARGFGSRDIDRQEEATPGTLYSICSMSKMFTGVAVMQLRDAGKVDLDAPVSTYLPWFAPEGETAAEPITLRHLLRHSSGLPCEAEHAVWDDPSRLFPDWDELLARAEHVALSYPVNTKHNYSNLGYALLGEIVATVSGQSYEDYVQQYLLDPLDMRDTSLFPPARRIRSRLATGYSHKLRGPATRVALVDGEPGAFAPAGGYYSTVLDLAKFAMWQFRVREGTDDRILSRSSLEEMQSVQWPEPKWGLGFTYYWIGDLDLYGHQGGCAKSGFKAQFILCPVEKTAVVVFFNAADGPEFHVAFSSYLIVSEVLRAAGEGSDGPDVGSQFAGYYEAAGAWSDAEVVEWDGGLAVLWVPTLNPTSSLVRLQQVEGGLYRQVDDAGNLGKHYAFAADAAGNVRMRFNNNILQRVER